jgi:hypothetical protein
VTCEPGPPPRIFSPCTLLTSTARQLLSPVLPKAKNPSSSNRRLFSITSARSRPKRQPRSRLKQSRQSRNQSPPRLALPFNPRSSNAKALLRRNQSRALPLQGTIERLPHPPLPPARGEVRPVSRPSSLRVLGNQREAPKGPPRSTATSLRRQQHPIRRMPRRRLLRHPR